MFANLGEMVYLYTSMGTTLVNTLVSMLCAVSPLKGECCAGLVSAGGWWLVMMLPSHAPEPLLTCTVTR